MKLSASELKTHKLNRHYACYRDEDEKTKCEASVEEAYGHCIIDCKGDSSCMSNCNREYDSQLISCPCNANCSNGCPCPNYECTKPKSAVLILNTANDLNIPLITDMDGRVEPVNFQYGPFTEAEGSCSIVFKGRAFVYGGAGIEQWRQISVVDSCQLTRVGTLPADMSYGACTTIGEELIYLCFDLGHTKTCRVGYNPVGMFDLIPDSTFIHNQIRIAASSCKSLTLFYNFQATFL